MARLKRKLLFGSLSALGGTAALTGALAATSVGGGSSADSSAVQLRAQTPPPEYGYDETVEYRQGITPEHGFSSQPEPSVSPPAGYGAWSDPTAKVILAPAGDNRNDDYRLGADPWRTTFGADLTPAGTLAEVVWRSLPTGAGDAITRRILVRFRSWAEVLVGIVTGNGSEVVEGLSRGYALAGAGWDEYLSRNWHDNVNRLNTIPNVLKSLTLIRLYPRGDRESGVNLYLSEQELRNPFSPVSDKVKNLWILAGPMVGLNRFGLPELNSPAASVTKLLP